MSAESLIVEIIKEQSLIIGENLAKSRAEDAGVLKFNSSKIEDITLTRTNPPEVIDSLIKSYEELFGQASIEVCFEVIKRYPLTEVSAFLPDNIKSKLK